MQVTRKAALLLLRSTFIFLCKLMLVDVVCSFVGSWLVYVLFERRRLVPPKFNYKRSHDDLGIEVIICGFPRTGCTSLWQAMDILGFPCFHAAHLYKPSTAKLFMKAQSTGARENWEQLLQGYKSIVDFPAASSYEKLIEIYPNAKIILNMRDPDNWYNSFSKTIMKVRESLTIEVIQPYMGRCTKVFFHKKLMKGQSGNKELSIANYKLHAEEVERRVPAHKLLLLDVEKNEGWAPLCNFLKVPIPNVPFPFANQREIVTTRIKKHIIIYRIVLFFYIAFILCTIVHKVKWLLSM